jgi:hypothetical protein
MDENQEWLEDILHEARARNWCTKPVCTTCGAWVFRDAYMERAAEHAGVELPEGRRFSRFKSLSPEGSEKIFGALRTALREVSPEWQGTDALRLILMDLHSRPIRWGELESLEDQLSGTLAGDEYLAMKAHAEYVAAVRSELDAYEAAAPERRAEKRQQAQLKHAARLEETKVHNKSRETLLERFTTLSDSERLVFLAEQADRFPLEMIPAALIPVEKHAPGLSPEQKSHLIKIIDHRKGRWGKLRKMLEESTN